MFQEQNTSVMQNWYFSCMQLILIHRSIQCSAQYDWFHGGGSHILMLLLLLLLETSFKALCEQAICLVLELWFEGFFRKYGGCLWWAIAPLNCSAVLLTPTQSVLSDPHCCHSPPLQSLSASTSSRSLEVTVLLQNPRSSFSSVSQQGCHYPGRNLSFPARGQIQPCLISEAVSGLISWWGGSIWRKPHFVWPASP